MPQRPVHDSDENPLNLDREVQSGIIRIPATQGNQSIEDSATIIHPVRRRTTPANRELLNDNFEEWAK